MFMFELSNNTINATGNLKRAFQFSFLKEAQEWADTFSSSPCIIKSVLEAEQMVKDFEKMINIGD